MNETTELHIREWDKSDTVFEMRGWSSEKGQAFVVDANKRRQVIRFVLPGLLARGGAVIGVTFPRAAPTRITETCLLPPPCRATEKEAEYLRAAAAVLRSPYGHTKSSSSSKDPNWELVWLRHRDEVLLPEPRDDEALIQQLVVFKAKQRETYEACRQELEEWGTKTIGQMIINGGGRHYRKLRNCKPAAMPKQIKMHLGRLETIYTRPLREFDGRQHGGRLNWTPDVARHEALVRDSVLQRRWAVSHKVNLAEMKSDKESFVNWYRAHCPAPAHRAVAGFQSLIPPAVWAHSADMALCAEVRFVAHFADGSRVWLAKCPMREPLLTAEEQRPFEALAPVTAPASNRLQSSPTARAENVSEAIAAAEILTKAGQRARADAEAGALSIAAAGDHVETKSQAAAQTLRRAQKDLQPTLDELETNQAQLEALVEQYKLKENPRQTRRALENHGVPKRIVDFILKHLLAGKAVPKAPSAARELQKKYATKDGLDRKTVHRHYQIAGPLLLAAGWPERLLPVSTAADASSAGKAGPKPHDSNAPSESITLEELEKRDSSETLSAVERLQQQETGSEDRDDGSSGQRQ